MFAVKTIIHPPVRFVLTITGIALCAILMLFLFAIYRGASEGSVGYVRESRADLWVLQEHTSNILRSSSLVPVSVKSTLQNMDGIKTVTPVFFILATVKTNQGPATVYLTGYDLKSGMGRPAFIQEGTQVENDDEVVIDRSFAEKYKIRTGDNFYIKNDTLKVVGLSSGTNMFVIQYAFISLQKAFEIAGFPYFVSCFEVQLDTDAIPAAVEAKLKENIKDIAVFDQQTFLENNQHEMESGILPLLYTVAVISAVVLISILSLILSMHVVERRNEYAVMKAIGAPGGFLPALILKQSLFLSLCGMITASVFFFPLLHVVAKFAPEVTGESSVLHFVIVLAGIGFICLFSTVIPVLKLRKIYPLEVFN